MSNSSIELAEANSIPSGGSIMADEWDDATVKNLHRHLRIHFRHLSSAVRQMAMRECLADIPPSRGAAYLTSCVEDKLNH